MNIVNRPKVFRARRDRSRERDHRREFPTFAHFVRAVTGFDYSTAKTVKSWSRTKHNRVREQTRGAIRFTGVPLRHVRDWQAGANNLKVAANLTSRSRLTLIYLDFDCHGRGKPTDARKLCDLVRDRLPHGQPLVTERGASAWVLVDLDVADRPKAAEYNALLDRIESYVRGVAAANRLDLSGVEIKGRVPTWDSRGMIDRCADMMKCPRSFDNIGQAVKYDSLLSTDWSPPAAPPKAKAKLRAGSRSLLMLSPKQAAGISNVVNLIRDWFPDRPTRTSPTRSGDTRLITDERFAEVLLVMAHLKPNKDGTMPHKFAEAVWKQWHAEGLLQYGWVSEVWQTVRDYLSENGYLHAEDGGRYVAPVRNAAGEIEVRGQAAKWCMADWVREHITATAEGGSIWDVPVGDSKPCCTGKIAVCDLFESRSVTQTRAGGELVHTSLHLPPGPLCNPWCVHQDWGIRPLSQIPAHDWERFHAMMAV